MYLPAPLRSLVTTARRKKAERATLRDLRSALDNVRARSRQCDAVKSAIERTVGQRPKDEQATFAMIERRRASLLKTTDEFQVIDYGAGYPHELPRGAAVQISGIPIKVTVCQVAGWSQDRIEGELLFHLVRAKRPTAALEMGTCVGISGSYMGAALRHNAQGHLWTIEGDAEIAKIARQTFTTMDLNSWVTSVVGPFHGTLAPTLLNGPFDFMFIDGHHDRDATINYFKQVKAHAAPSCIIVFDDVDYSPTMLEAWEQIARDSSVRELVEIAHLGIVVLN